MMVPIAEEDGVRSICKNCKNRFRRVFIPSNLQKFFDLDEEIISEAGEDVVIMTMCLASDMDLDTDETIECTHFVPKTPDTGLFKHI